MIIRIVRLFVQDYMKFFGDISSHDGEVLHVTDNDDGSKR